MEIVVKNALEIEDLDYLKLAKLYSFNEKEIKMLKLFWDPAFNDSWIYLSSKLIHEYFGYKETKSSMSNFYKKMRECYIENINYIEVSKDHEVVKLYQKIHPEKKVGEKYKDPASKKYYIITGETFKKMGMKANTVKGDEMCDYYIKVEKLAQMMYRVLKEKELIKFKNEVNEKERLLLESKEAIEEKEKQLQISERKNLKLTTRIKDITVLKINGFVYISTTKQYSQNNQYKIGKTVKLDGRMSTYQSGRAKGDEMYYVYIFESEDIDTLELLLRRLLIQFRDRKTKDMYVLQWSLLHRYMNNVCLSFRNIFIDKFNELIIDNIEFDNNIEFDDSEESIPKPFDFENKDYKFWNETEEEDEVNGHENVDTDSSDNTIVCIRTNNKKRNSVLKSLDELRNMFVNWFHDTYRYTNDSKKFITMKLIYEKYKKSDIYLGLRYTEKNLVKRCDLLDMLLTDPALNKVFQKKERYHNNLSFTSSFSNFCLII